MGGGDVDTVFNEKFRPIGRWVCNSQEHRVVQESDKWDIFEQYIAVSVDVTQQR